MLMTVKELAERLRCSVSTIYQNVALGELRAFRVGAGNSGLRFSEEQIQDFLHRRETKGGKRPEPQPTPRNTSAGGFTVLDGDRLKEAWQDR